MGHPTNQHDMWLKPWSVVSIETQPERVDLFVDEPPTLVVPRIFGPWGTNIDIDDHSEITCQFKSLKIPNPKSEG